MNKARQTPSIQADAKAEPSDRELVARAQKGDRAAWRAIYDRYSRRCFALALGVVHNRDEALDVVQEAFLRAFKHLAGFEGASSLYTWLYRIVMNAAIDHLRRQSRAPSVDYDDAVAHLESEAPADAQSLVPQLVRGNPAKELVRREIREKLDDALGKLSANHRAVLVMREIEGLSYEEMAKEMKCSKGTIMSRLFHARRYMQNHLLELYGSKEGLEDYRTTVTGDEQELLMRYLDGEMTREEARAFEQRLAASPELETARGALAQVHDVVVARYARAAEEAGPELDRLWAKIEAGMDAPAAAAVPSAGVWTRLTDGIKAWFEQYRGYVAVGAASGLAGVLLALALVKVPGGPGIVYVGGKSEVPMEAASGGVSGGGSVLVANVSAAEIESLEVEGGSGTIFRIPADDGEAPTTVIWVTRDEEGPI